MIDAGYLVPAFILGSIVGFWLCDKLVKYIDNLAKEIVEEQFKEKMDD